MPSTDSTTISREVEQVYTDLVAAVTVRELDWLKENLTDDFVLVIPSFGPDSVIGKQDYITQVGSLKGVEIELCEINVHARGKWATVQFTAEVMEEIADSSELDAEALKVRERSPVDTAKDLLSTKSEQYFTGVLRREDDRWRIVLHSFLGPVD